MKFEFQSTLLDFSSSSVLQFNIQQGSRITGSVIPAKIADQNSKIENCHSYEHIPSATEFHCFRSRKQNERTVHFRGQIYVMQY
ncbi:hypothetical protein MIMGU_mgv11b023794mg [Erythranthe guttata]|uniref:Uncharacterized protein n=1 Tax=Erythranthe guttata TaxID=4155 RepID=A0A022QI71_ERYGU|nr:hypothetical protein MIMGU_mgv11b023794mg [Erythranthe guttata]